MAALSRLDGPWWQLKVRLDVWKPSLAALAEISMRSFSSLTSGTSSNTSSHYVWRGTSRVREGPKARITPSNLGASAVLVYRALSALCWSFHQCNRCKPEADVAQGTACGSSTTGSVHACSDTFWSPWLPYTHKHTHACSVQTTLGSSAMLPSGSMCSHAKPESHR